MKILLKNHLENAYESLRSNRLRASLTMIGVTIGIASITIILSLAHSTSSLLVDKSSINTDKIALIRSGVKPESSAPLTDTQILTSSTLTLQDTQAMSALPDTTVSPMSILHTDLTAGDQTVDAKDTTLVGTNQNFLEIADLKLSEGEFTDEVQGAVIGRQLAIDLFGTEDAIGNVLKIRNEPLTVIGLLETTKSQTNYLGIDFDHSALVTSGVIKQFTNDNLQIQQIVLSASNTKTLKNSIAEAEQILAKLHKNDHDYYILTGNEITAPSSQFTSAILTSITIIAIISLLVGGVSIMNVMLASVAERQREVGIRKAIGATNSQIINQFVIESAIIGLIGGIVGYAIGIAIIFILGAYLPFTPSIQWQVALFAIITSIATGIIFGLYPAIRAAQKDPIETLRY